MRKHPLQVRQRETRDKKGSELSLDKITCEKCTLLTKLRSQRALRNCSTPTFLAINNSVQQDAAVPNASYTREKLSSKCSAKGFRRTQPVKMFPLVQLQATTHLACFLSFGNCQSKNKKLSPQEPNSSALSLKWQRTTIAGVPTHDASPFDDMFGPLNCRILANT